MADHAKGIAVIALRLADQPMLKPLIDVPRMAEIGREMLQGQLDAFLHGDVDEARALAARDAEIDQLNDQVYRELLMIMMTDPRTITRATYLLWVAHNLERFADRTTNIGERVVFMRTNAIGDALRLIIDTVGASKGATVTPKGVNPGIMRASDRMKQVQDQSDDTLQRLRLTDLSNQIGRASCRERV